MFAIVNTFVSFGKTLFPFGCGWDTNAGLLDEDPVYGFWLVILCLNPPVIYLKNLSF